MFLKVRSFFTRHPVLREVLLWALPAILFGAVLRLLFLHYSPYAYWGSDSKSYFSFAHKLVTDHYISLDEKRRFIYPILLAPVAMLPGAKLQWLAWIQHACGLLTILPVAYIVRRSFVFWRWWIVPVTVAFTGMPMLLWYEHELLGETFFFYSLVWAFGGWVAWVSQARRARVAQYFWWFFTPFALFILTKPSGRFVWPGVFVGLLLVYAWRKLERRHWIALGVLAVATLAVGSRKQGAWLAYVSTFPLTQLDTPLHADYKAEIRPVVEKHKREISTYYLHDDFPFAFLESPSRKAAPDQPLWKALDKDPQKKSKLYTDLVIEGITAEPGNFLYLAWQRIVASVNLSDFKQGRFDSDFYPDRLVEHYGDGVEALAKGKNSPIPMLYGLPWDGPLPPYEEFRHRLSPAPNSFSERTVRSWVAAYAQAADVVKMPEDEQSVDRDIAKARLLPLGYWLIAAIGLAFTSRYRRTLGVLTLIGMAYVAGVFLISQPNPRYFCPAWPVMLLLFALPADVLLRMIASLFTRRTAPAQA